MPSRFAIAGGVLAFCAVAVSPQRAIDSFTGTISDSVCGAHHVMANATPAECTRACIKKGADFELVVGSKVYMLNGDKAQLDRFAGKNVTIMGEATGDVIIVKSIALAKS